MVKLGDFGVAKAQNLLANREGAILLGKAPYMSPEQAQYRETDARSDLFSLGTVFYRLLTGTSVFDGADLTATLAKVVEAEPPPVTSLNPEVPEALSEILEKALARRPEARYQTAGDMGYALEHFMYHDRFGPTNVTLEAYLAELAPAASPVEASDEPPPSATQFATRPTKATSTEAATELLSDD